MCYLNGHYEGDICDGSGYRSSSDENLESGIFWNSDTMIKNATTA